METSGLSESIRVSDIDKNNILPSISDLLAQQDSTPSLLKNMELSFAKMLDLISPSQNEDENLDYVQMYEHLGFFEPEIKNDDTYNQLVQAVKDDGKWFYSDPNRIEPVHDGLVDIDQLQSILNMFEYGPDDFFRGSITLWGIYDHKTANRMHPNYLEVIYIKNINGHFRVVKNVLKDGTTQ